MQAFLGLMVHLKGHDRVGRRPTIADVAKAAGVSVATVDRVLNKRHPVREETTDRVLHAAESVKFYATDLLKQRVRPDAPQRTLGFVLQKRAKEFYQSLAAALAEAAQNAPDVRGRAVIEFASELSPGAVIEKLKLVGARSDAVAVVAVDHPSITQAIDALLAKGVPTFGLLTGLTAPNSAGYLGIDNRQAGRMAAWAIARMARQPGQVGLLLGSHRYLGHELREIGFRSFFREHAPAFKVLDAIVNLEEERIAYEATLDLLKRHPNLAGIFVAGGGMEGVIEALREEDQNGSLAVVVPELTSATRAALVDGFVTLVIATPVQLLARRAVETMIRAVDGSGAESARQLFLPFELYTSENL